MRIDRASSALRGLFKVQLKFSTDLQLVWTNSSLITALRLLLGHRADRNWAHWQNAFIPIGLNVSRSNDS